MKHLLMILIASCLTFSCALDTSTPEEEGQTERNDQVEINMNSDYEGNGSSCSPAITLVVNGVTHHQPMLCPIPTRPDPDPEFGTAGIDSNDGIISPETNKISGHSN